jgi:LytR cell envelope-related transcriptional attenuator
VEHSLPRLPTIPWKTATIVAGAVAAIELVLLIVLGVALLGNSVGDRVRESAAATMASATPKATTDGKPRLTRPETSVLVLNGNGRTGAAAEASDRVRAYGYGVGGVGNAPHTGYPQNVVMYRPGYRPEALRFARDLGLGGVAPLDGLRLKELMGAHVVLILGA